MVAFFKVLISVQPLLLKLTFRGMPAFESRDEEKYFKYIFYLKIKPLQISIKIYFIFGDLNPKYPAPIIHKDGDTIQKRLKNTEIRFMYFNLMDVFLYNRGNRLRNPGVCLAQFGRHRCME